jgi:hypothetical protein
LGEARGSSAQRAVPGTTAGIVLFAIPTRPPAPPG